MKLCCTPQAASLLAGPIADMSAACEATLSRAREWVSKLKALPPANDARVLALYDDVTAAMSNMGARVGLAKEVHPDQAFRQECESCEQQLEAYNVELSLDRGLYDALARVEVAGLDAVSAFWLFKTLREFRRSGVDKDEATREKVRSLNEELVKIGQSFGRNIRDDVRVVRLEPGELEGLPADWLATHPPGADGKREVTTNTPDYLPVMTYAQSAQARQALWRAYRQRAFPQNREVLNSLLRTRHQLAALLGYPDWAAYVTETKMVKTVQAASDFIEKGRQITLQRAEADMAALLRRKQRDFPGATEVDPWEHQFFEDRIKQESYGLDSQALRTYFEYESVKKGVMHITSTLFGVQYRQVSNAQVWHPEVETYDLFDGEQLLGRIHLDMHPREGKYKHAAQFGLTVGRLDRELPESVLVCNFPRAGELLQHSEVETFFHEFGHLLHEIFAGRQPWAGVSGIRTEWDFVEVPSMLLQEWPLDGAVLKAFARHHQTGEPISDALVSQLKRAKAFGVGADLRRQFFLSAVSLAFHDRAPGFDTSELLREIQQRFLPFRREWVEGTHFEFGFGHLDGYSAIYYTYQWSTVIAKDLLTRFRSKGLLDGSTAIEYRRRVLEPGGSKEAGMLVQDFLGRPHSFDAFQAWLEGEN